MAKLIALFCFGLLLLLVAISLQSAKTDVPFELNSAEMRHLEGHVYEVPTKRRLDWPWQPISNSPHDPDRSRLLLFENRQVAGLAHSRYDQIRSAGAGNYTHWGATHSSLVQRTTLTPEPTAATITARSQRESRLE